MIDIYVRKFACLRLSFIKSCGSKLPTLDRSLNYLKLGLVLFGQIIQDTNSLAVTPVSKHIRATCVAENIEKNPVEDDNCDGEDFHLNYHHYHHYLT